LSNKSAQAYVQAYASLAYFTEHTSWLWSDHNSTEQAAADQQRKLSLHQQSQEQEQQHMHCKE